VSGSVTKRNHSRFRVVLDSDQLAAIRIIIIGVGLIMGGALGIATGVAPSVPIVAGTDQAVPGFSLDREIELYVQAGFTPMEAIQAATLVPARAMGMEKDSGTIEVGKRADVILVDGNPLENISDIRKVSTVFAAGRKYEPAALWTSVGFKP